MPLHPRLITFHVPLVSSRPNQVLDARDPLGCISQEVEKWIRFNYPDKLFVRLLNKIGILILLRRQTLCVLCSLINVSVVIRYLKRFYCL